MKHTHVRLIAALALLSPLLAGPLLVQMAHAGNSQSPDAHAARVVEHWTKQRRADATPRDLVIDPRGYGYLRKPDGSLQPHGHRVAAESTVQHPTPLAKPPGAGGGSQDSTPPDISGMNPGSGDEIGASHAFSATITDASGIKSVSFILQYPDGLTQKFTPQEAGSDTWSTTLQGFTDGNWAWWVEAKDAAGKGGNRAISEVVPFTVNTGGSGDDGGGDGGTGSDTMTNGAWTGGAVQTAAGRIYFEMPANPRRKGPWSGYVCSGTVVDDGMTGRSVVLTAAHCVYDDVNKAFARNVLFIPNQAGTTGSGTDLNCYNDPLGCWAPAFGVVDADWTTRTFPDNIPWDYAYYVVSDTGAHAGTASSSDALDEAANALPISFQAPIYDNNTGTDFTHALGYSYSDDPDFMYCAEDMTTEGTANWWLPNCGLSGGSSGGPWVQPLDTVTGSGDVISVNSWGYTNSPGMAGPKLVGTSAGCLFTKATTNPFTAPGNDGDAGIVEGCP